MMSLAMSVNDPVPFALVKVYGCEFGVKLMFSLLLEFPLT